MSGSKDLSPPIYFPYNHGVVLWVNAVRDAYMILDGPGCAFYRAMQVHGRHDWNSTLLSHDGDHRFQYAGVDANTIASRSAEMIGGVIRRVAKIEKCRAIVVTQLPMCTIAGTDHNNILRFTAGGKPSFSVTGTSLSGDWYQGYARAVRTFAEDIDLPKGSPKKENAAVIGHFMDRCEGDQRGNLAEYKRMLAGIGLNLVSVWPSGGTLEDLKSVKDAGTVISLPYGRQGAEILAKRLGAALVETEVPFGLGATQAWLRKVAAATGKEREAEAFIEAELDRTAPLLEWVIPFVFLNKKLVFYGDPHLAPGLFDICEDLGIKLTRAFLMGAPGKRAAPDRDGIDVGPHMSAVRERWREIVARKAVDFVIGPTDCLSQLKVETPYLEFGFPSVWTHFLREEPFLGFEGFLSLVDRMSQALLKRKSSQSWTAVHWEKSSKAGSPAAEMAA